MANLCKNLLEILGPRETIMRFRSATSLLQGSEMIFHHLIPNNSNTSDEEIWGTSGQGRHVWIHKSELHRTSERYKEDVRDVPHQCLATYQTNWEPNDKFIREAGKLFPDLVFRHFWLEDQMGLAGYALTHGDRHDKALVSYQEFAEVEKSEFKKSMIRKNSTCANMDEHEWEMLYASNEVVNISKFYQRNFHHIPVKGLQWGGNGKGFWTALDTRNYILAEKRFKDLNEHEAAWAITAMTGYINFQHFKPEQVKAYCRLLGKLHAIVPSVPFQQPADDKGLLGFGPRKKDIPLMLAMGVIEMATQNYLKGSEQTMFDYLAQQVGEDEVIYVLASAKWDIPDTMNPQAMVSRVIGSNPMAKDFISGLFHMRGFDNQPLKKQMFESVLLFSQLQASTSISSSSPSLIRRSRI